MEEFLEKESIRTFFAWWKPGGIYDGDSQGGRSLSSMILLMMPEILIVIFMMLNEIKLKLMGLYYRIEADLETLPDGI